MNFSERVPGRKGPLKYAKQADFAEIRNTTRDYANNYCVRKNLKYTNNVVFISPTRCNLCACLLK